MSKTTDIIARLLLQTGDFNRNLASAKNDVKNLSGTLGSMGGALTKVAGIFGVTATAVGAFEKSMNSSQKLNDLYENTMGGLKGAVDEFFYSIANGDWTNWFNGISGVIDKAKEAKAALDDLGNTSMSYNYFNAKNMADFSDQLAIIKDKTSSKEQVEAAKERVKEILRNQQEISQVYSDAANDALKKQVSKFTGIESTDLKLFDIEDIFRIDVTAVKDETKAKLEQQYKDYQKVYSDIVSRNQKQTPIMTPEGVTIISSTTDWDAVSREMQGIIPAYKEAILYNGILNKATDEELKQMMELGQTAANVQRAYSSMVQTANKATQKDIVTPKTSPKAVEKFTSQLEKMKNDLAEWNRKLDDGLAKGTDTTEAVKKVAALQKAIKELEDKRHQIDLEIKYSMPVQDVRQVADMRAISNPTSIPKDAMDLKKIDVTKNGIMSIGDAAKKAFSDNIESMYAFAEGLGYMGQMADSVGGAFEAMGASSMASIYQVASSIMQGVQQFTQIAAAAKSAAVAQGVASASAMPFPFNLAAIATVVATITSIFASFAKFADGGIVGGNSFSGDRQLVRVNSGEMILNKNQQARLFNLLDGDGQSGRVIRVDGEARVSGKDMYIAIRNYMKSTNKTW